MSDQTPEPPPPQQKADESNYYRPQYIAPDTDPMGKIIPTANPKALTGYYVGCGSIIPCLGLVLGPIAIFLGVAGLKAARENPQLPGKAHAITGILAGTVGFLYNLALTLIFVFAFFAQRAP